MRKHLLLLAAFLPFSLTSCEAIGKMMEGKSKEKYAYDYAEAWLDLQVIVDLTQTPQIDQQKYTRQLQATEIEVSNRLADYSDRPEANSGSYRKIYEIIDHYKHAAENWKNRKGAILVMRQFEEAEDLFEQASEEYEKEYDRPLDEVVQEVNMARMEAFKAEKEKQDKIKKAKEAAKGGGGHH